MQTKKKVKERNFGDHLHLIGRAMGKKFTDCIVHELGDAKTLPLRLTLKYRPGSEHDWYNDPAISISIEGSNMTIFENLTGHDIYEDNEDEDSEDEE